MESYYVKVLANLQLVFDQNQDILNLLRAIAEVAVAQEEQNNPDQKTDLETALSALLDTVINEPKSPKIFYAEEELLTIKEAQGILNISRWKIYDMYRKNQLTMLKRSGRVRLIVAEVEAARRWYSIPKGKI